MFGTFETVEQLLAVCRSRINTDFVERITLNVRQQRFGYQAYDNEADPHEDRSISLRPIHKRPVCPRQDHRTKQHTLYASIQGS